MGKLIDVDTIPFFFEENVAVVAYKADIEQLSPVQPEIVRCKDCKWFGDIGCAISIVDDSDKPTENDFCSFAERRTDETP